MRTLAQSLALAVALLSLAFPSSAVRGSGAAVLGVTPSSGFQSGGQVVAVQLEGFVPNAAVEVMFGPTTVIGVPLGTLQSSSASVVTPASATAGPVTVVVRQDLGGGNVIEASSAGGFTFLPPELIQLSHVSGPQAGFQQISATVAGFQPGPIVVRMGGKVTQATVFSQGNTQLVSWNTPAAFFPGSTSVRFTQGALDLNVPAAYTYLAPQLLAVTPGKSAWYVDQELVLLGNNFAPNELAQVSIGGVPLGFASVISANEVRFQLTAGAVQLPGAQDVTLDQAGVTATRVKGWACLPTLTVGQSGSALLGGTLELRVETQQSGFAYLFGAFGTQPFPLLLTDFYYGLTLDVATAFNLGVGGLLVQPTLTLSFPPGLVPPGLNLPLQALTVELGSLGNYFSFSNTVVATIP
ncbi:MAG: hypothetical protein GC161_13845 [Planctomycetaceae bacterium]|nr:hypothetical protein [Planctomycetaceae bacterium]